MNHFHDCCQLCTKTKVPKKRIEDIVERTTQCRILTETGTGLNVREVYCMIDEDFKRRSMACLCKEPSISSSSTDSRVEKQKLRKKKNKVAGDVKVSNKVAARQKNITTKRSSLNPYEIFKSVMQSAAACGDKHDRGCQDQFKSIILPKWYHQLSDKQMGLVDTLPAMLTDAYQVDTYEAVQIIFIELGMNPYPTLNQIVKSADPSPVLFLVNLLEDTKRRQKMCGCVPAPESFISQGTNPLCDYSLNERLLMSCISYLEMPLLLRFMALSLPRVPDHPIPDPYVPLKTAPDVEKQNPCPYLQPVWVQSPKDWRARREVENQRRLVAAKIMRRAPCPSRIYGNTEILTHVHKILKETSPSPEVVPTPRKSPVFIEECCVTAWRRQLTERANEKMKYTHPATPPPSCGDVDSERNDNVSTGCLLNEVVIKFDSDFLESPSVRRKDSEEILTEVIPKYSDIESGLAGTIEELQQRGMVCAFFPDIESHPIVLQLIHHLQRVEMDKGLSKSLIKKMNSTHLCLLELFGSPHIQDTPDQPTESHWGRIEYWRKYAQARRQVFLSYLWKERYQTSQNLWQTLNPGFIWKRSFLPTFYAYMLSAGYEQLNSSSSK